MTKIPQNAKLAPPHKGIFTILGIFAQYEMLNVQLIVSEVM